MKKLSKDQLREDEFLEGIMSAVDYVRDHYQIFAGALALVILSVVGVEYIIQSQQRARSDAAGRLGTALMLEEQGQQDEATQEIQNVLDQYAGTPAAGQALAGQPGKGLLGTAEAAVHQLRSRSADGKLRPPPQQDDLSIVSGHIRPPHLFPGYHTLLLNQQFPQNPSEGRPG